MKRALRIVSLLTLVIVGAAIAGQALVVIVGVSYGPDGQPIDPTPVALVVSSMAGLGGLLAMPLAFATFLLGLVLAADNKEYGWLAAMVAAGVFALVGLVVMAWVLLSVRSPVAFQTPLAVIPLVTLLYGRVSARADSRAAVCTGSGIPG